MTPWAIAALLSCAVPAPAPGQSTIWEDPAFSRYREAAAAREARDYARAAARAREAIAAYPDHALAHYLLGQVALPQSQWQEAVAPLARVVTLNPGASAAQRSLGARPGLPC
jgi:TolA-binding protein